MKISKKTRNIGMAVLVAVLFLSGAVAGWFFRKGKEMPQPTFLRENPNDYKFIDPILLLKVPEDTVTPQFQSLRQTISSYVATAQKQGKASDVSVYFRQLNNDRWVGVNATHTYAPASMLKVISLIAFLRQAQLNPALYTTNVTIPPQTPNPNNNQDFYPPADPIQIGSTYNANLLLSHMIIDSDNNAANAINSLTGASLNKTFNDLQIPIPGPDTPTDFISPIVYSRLFRSIYNGAYLSDVISEQSLELLSKTTFTQGLVAGVPSGTVVSHKFGERTITSPSAAPIRELSDCGIIYAPNDPYLLCVMTKGTDFTKLQSIIGDISNIAWKSIQQLDAQK